MPRQSAPRQSVLPQSAPHAKVPLTPKCPFMLICQSGIHANVALCQSCTHAKVVIRQNVRVKVFHAKVFYAKMSDSRPNFLVPRALPVLVLVFEPKV